MALSRTNVPTYAPTQGFLIISRAPSNALIGLRLIDAGALAIEGDYECEFATDGMNVIEAELMCSAVTGTVAPSLKAMRHAGNFGSARSSQVDTGGNLVAGTPQVLTVTDLHGALVAKVTFTIGAGESVTFDQGTDYANPTALAEHRGL